MKKEDNIDDLLKEALSKEDTKILKRIEDEGIFDLLASNFKGKLKWIAYYTIVIILVFSIAMFYSLYKFLGATEVVELIQWGAGFFASMVIVGMLKTWHWMQMDRNALTREIKRLELQISMLIKK